MTLHCEDHRSALDAGDTGAAPLRQEAQGPEALGFSTNALDCGPKIAALASLAHLAPGDPIASVSYHSQGNLLVVAGDSQERALAAAERVADRLHVTVLGTQSGSRGKVTLWSGRVESLTGYLGEFAATLGSLRTAPQSAPVDSAPARFDLVLDFSAAPLIGYRQPPQGYFTAGSDDTRLAKTLEELADSVGEFEKPKYFAFRENLCAHSRSGIVGCNACIEACSTAAITSDGDKVKVDPHLCMGCGTCATVCPSGAMSYQFPRVADRGAQMKRLLATFRATGGRDACIVFHNGGDGRQLLARSAEAGRGLPARALPLEAWSVCSIGLDVMLGAIAYGASQVVLVCAGTEDAVEVRALRDQCAIAEALLAGLGYAGAHLSVIEAGDLESLERGFAALAPGEAVATPAVFQLSNDKRTAIEFAVEHLLGQAPRPVREIALAAGAPWGEVRVDRDKCTMCMSCVGACPESALMDGVDQPLLKFLERNCVQCGLCESTCPEDAITLHPRLLLTAAAREARVLNETQPFHCVSCGKAFGTKQLVDAMLGRLSGHSMFAQPGALRRLQMCADCRVVDMMSSKSEASIFNVGKEG